MWSLDRRTEGLSVYRVGGAVRDKLLGWPVVDNDWVVVGATPGEMQARGFKPVGRDFPVFLHPDTAEEYALARTERKAGHGYSGFEVHATPDVTLEEDLLRRDLTLNAIAEGPDGQLIDPFDGQAAITHRRLQHVSAAFSEDPLRVLRTARFLARYAERGFVIADETLALMQVVSDSGELAHLAAERVWVETEKALGEPSPASFFTTLAACGALASWFAELVDTMDSGLARLAWAPEHTPHALAHWRYALLVAPLGEAERDALAQRLRLPNAVSQLARQVALTEALLAEPLEAERVLHWLERLDGWRKPDQVTAQLALVACLAKEQQVMLATAWQAANAVSPQALVAEGLRGAAIGTALRQRRWEAVEQALRSSA